MKEFLKFIGKYKKYAILSPICVIGEAVMEILIPFIMAKIIDIGVIGLRSQMPQGMAAKQKNQQKT